MKLGKFVSMHFALLNYLLSKNEISPVSPTLSTLFFPVATVKSFRLAEVQSIIKKI